jgi:protein SCO1/2
MNTIRPFVCMLVLALAATLSPAPLPAADAAPATGAALPGDSAYQLAVPLVDQDGKGLQFADGRGRPRVVSMFYTSCKFICPLIIDTVLKTERALPEADRARFDVLLVSLDPDRDTPAALKQVADKRRLDTARWRLARTDKAHVRRLAAVLGIQYKQLEDGEFSHSSALVLLDADGRIVARTEKLGAADPEFVAAVARTLAR